LAIDSANPLIESDRKDALAVSARAMPAPARIIASTPRSEILPPSPNQHQ
jgi:hypothetical protein